MAEKNWKLNPDRLPGGPLANLERSLIEEFLKGRGYRLSDLKALPEAQARKLRVEASIHASNKLAEVETRSRLIHEIHGDFSRGGA